MSRKRRDAASSQRSMGDFVSRGGSRNRVEISDDEDDEIEEINTQELTESNRSSRLSRLRTRRQRREIEEEHLFQDDEPNDEWQQLQQVLMMSKIEADKHEERRKMCGTMQDVMNLQVQIEPLNSSRSKSAATETARKTTGDKREDEQEDQREGAESPDLFVTPPDDQEQLSDKVATNEIESDPEFPNSPSLPVTMRSPDLNGKDGKETRQDNGDTRRKLSLRRSKREAADLSSQKEDKPKEKSNVFESEVADQVIQSETSKNDDVNPGEKRKLEEDDDDVTDDEDDEPLVELKKRSSLKRKRPWVSLENSDSDDMQDVDKKSSKRSPDGLHDPSPKRIAVSDTDEEAKTNGNAETRQIRTPANMIRLSRRYKKTRCRPANLKEAMKANIYFAPPGFDLPAYTKLIIRMFEKFRRRLYVAQSKVKTRIPWGPPVVPGTRDTLDLQLPRRSTASIGTRASVFVRNSVHGAGTDTKSQAEFDTSDRRRSLRSSSNPVKQATASTSTSKGASATVPPYKVDSDSDDDDDCMKSYLDEMARPSVSSSTKKPAPSLSRNRGRFGIDFSKIWGTGKTKATGEPSVKTQTKSSSDGVTSNVEIADDRKEETREPVLGDHGSLDDANAVSDLEVQSNTVGSSGETLENNSEVTTNSGTSQAKMGKKNSSSESSGVLPESKTASDDVSLMDTDQENLAEIIRPPKRRSVSRPAISDDSTDDEGDLSQPMFSMRLPAKETSVGSKVPDSGDVAETRDQGKLAGRSHSPQSESQRMVGKSILDTMAADGEELLPSQTLLQSDITANSQMEETAEEGSFDVAGTSSSAASSSTKQVKDRLAEEEKEVVDIDSSGSERARRTRSATAEKAAAAAERRQQMASRQNLRAAGPSSSRDDYFCTREPKDAETEMPESTVECPLCYQRFGSEEIEAHASDCQGPPTQSEETGARSEPGPSTRSVPARADTKPLPSIYRTLTGERGKLKSLKVVLQRSPVVEQKLLRKSTQETESAKRSLAFENDSRPSGSLDQCRSSRSSDQDMRKPSRNTRAALRTESDSEESGYAREKEESSSAEVYSWLETSSPEKKKPRYTYGSYGRGNAPKLDGDYIPLNATEESEEDDACGKASKGQEPRKTFSERTDEVQSDSDTSDDGLMVQYGAQRVAPRRKEPKQVTTDETDENEIALAILGGRIKKRPLSLSKGSKAKKSRRPRDSDSEESDEASIVCQLCNKKIPKESYRQHVDEELELRKRAKKNIPRKAEVVTVKHKKESKDEQRRSSMRVQAQKIPCSGTTTEDTENDDVDWDKVSNSPIKCFQFTENSNSVVDFENQFEHLKETKSGKRRSNYGQNDDSTRGNRGGFGGCSARGGYRGSGNRGSYRGSYKKVYGRGKKYGKYGGSRGRK